MRLYGGLFLMLTFSCQLIQSEEFKHQLIGAGISSETRVDGFKFDESGFGVGYQYNMIEWLSFSAHYKDFGDVKFNAIADYGFDLSSTSVLFLAQPKWSIGSFEGFAVVGWQRWSREGHITTLIGSQRYRSSGTDPLYGVGLNYLINPRLSFFLSKNETEIDEDKLRFLEVGLKVSF